MKNDDLKMVKFLVENGANLEVIHVSGKKKDSIHSYNFAFGQVEIPHL